VLKKEMGSIHYGMTNPGIGGTDFQLLSLALLLIRTKEFKVELICHGEIPADLPGNLGAVSVSEINTLNFERILIAPVSTMLLLKPRQISRSKIILSSHHPHDLAIKPITKKYPVALVRVVGAYSYFSQEKISQPISYIPNLFLSEPKINTRHRDGTGIPLMGNVSSQHRSKGLHHILQIYKSLRNKMLGLEFEIIGGRELYGNTEKFKFGDDSNFSLSGYDKKLLRMWEGINGNDLKIKKFGVQTAGVGKIISNWNFAIINPLGIGESDPASIKDCLSQNVPIFSTPDFGNWDYMRYFPELSAKRAIDIESTILNFFESPKIIEKVDTRITELCNFLIKRNDEIEQVWYRTIKAIYDSEFQIEKFSKIFLPTFLSRRMFWSVTLRRHIYKIRGAMTLENSLRDRLYALRLKI
jgi:hypothetical protein